MAWKNPRSAEKLTPRPAPADLRCARSRRRTRRGRAGERYILGGHNTSYRDIFERIAREAGVAPISKPASRWLAARRELGYTPGPIEPAIRDALASFQGAGMLGNRSRRGA